MSSLIIEVCTLGSVDPHSNADRLEVTQVKGWQCAVPKGQMTQGDAVVYFPPDTLLPKKWTDNFGVTKYCQTQPNDMFRIRKAKLRGEPSFGLVVKIDPKWYIHSDPCESWWCVGDDVADFFGAEKYEPPVLGHAGDVSGRDPDGFHRFTEIENMRNFPDLLEDGEEVVVTEKIHGTSSRLAAINGEIIAGSKNLPRKRPETEDEMKSNFYWLPYTSEGVKEYLEQHAELQRENSAYPQSIVLYGEVYGRVQSLRYGLTDLRYRCFAIAINGKYVDYDNRMIICKQWNIPMVPEVWRGPFSLEKIKELSEGNTIAENVEQIREGVVTQPVVERTNARLGRVILKYVSDTYLFGSDADKDTTDI